MSLLLFERTDRLSKQLQQTGVSVGQGTQMTQYAIKELTTLRSDSSFDVLWQDALDRSQRMKADLPTLPKRQVAAPKRFQSAQPYTFRTVEEYYRVQYFEVLDRAITCLTNRIACKELRVLSAIETLLHCAWRGDALNRDDLDVVCSNYGDDLDRSRLEAQLQGLENLSDLSAPQKVANSVDFIINAIASTPLKAMIPQVLLMCKLYLVIPATTATPERTFSRLRCLKTYLRSTMTQTRMNALMMMSIYCDKLDNLDMTKLVNDFIKSGDCKRLNAFALIQ